MQDRYAGDAGDFVKLALLRQLVASQPPSPPSRLGVVWYRVPDEDHNADGKHTSYLTSAKQSAVALRALDPDLAHRLTVMKDRKERSTVKALEAADMLPADSVTYSEALTFEGLASSDRRARVSRRQDWIAGAKTAVAGADLVFVDPDNGVRRTSIQRPAIGTKQRNTPTSTRSRSSSNEAKASSPTTTPTAAPQ